MEKKIAGYNLNKLGLENIESIGVILDASTVNISDQKTFGVHIPLTSHQWISKLTKSGVIDIWCEPVYEEEKYVNGEWYCGDNTSGHSWIFKYNGNMDDVYLYHSYCINKVGCITIPGLIHKNNVIGKAATEQLLSHFTAAAERLGYKEGVYINGFTNSSVTFSNKGTTMIDGDFFMYLGSRVFNLITCRWAEIIKSKIEPDPLAEAFTKIHAFLTDLENGYKN